MNTNWLRNGCLCGAIAAIALAAGCDSKYVATPIPPPGSGGAGGEGGASTSSSSGSSGIGGFDPNSPPCGIGKNIVLAVDKILLGDTDPNGAPNPTSAWKQYGFDLDGRFSTKTSTDLCQPTAGGSKAAIYPDGNNGIDNSFGKNVLPILLGLSADLSTTINESIANGALTYLLSIADVGPESCQTSSAFFLGANLGKLPSWDGTDVWPIDPSSLISPMDPTTPKCVYPQTLLANGLVGMTPPSQFSIILNVSGLKIILPIQRASMLLQLAPDNQTATGGIIGGIMDREELVNQFSKSFAGFDPSFCDPNSPPLISILNQIRQASDIMLDGTQDPSKECDGISIGLGFTMRSAQLGPAAPIPPPPSDPCFP